ncbi:MAG: hypothetical protein AB8U25_03590 [Rickettsiales endosymbiont of Dermacentor nuttalli]
MDNNSPNSHNDKNNVSSTSQDENIKSNESKKTEEQKINQETIKQPAEQKQEEKIEISKISEKDEELKKQTVAKESKDKEIETDKDSKLNDIKSLIADARRAMANGNFDSAYSLLNSAQELIASNPTLKGTGVENSIQNIKSDMMEMRSGYETQLNRQTFAEQRIKELEKLNKLLQNNLDITYQVIEKADKHLYKDIEHKLQIDKIRDKHKCGEKLTEDEEKAYHEVLHKKFNENAELHQAAHEHTKQAVKQLEEHKAQHGLDKTKERELADFKQKLENDLFDKMMFDYLPNQKMDKHYSNTLDNTPHSEANKLIKGLSTNDSHEFHASLGNLSPPNLPNKHSPSSEKSR